MSLRVLGVFVVVAASGCVREQGDVVKSGRLVSIVAGEYYLGGDARGAASYLIDRQTRTCWLETVGWNRGLAELDCCRARLDKQARRFIDWEDEASCLGRVPKLIPAAPASPTN